MLSVDPCAQVSSRFEVNIFVLYSVLDMAMRTESEMLDLILRTAREDERIRAVIMNGSRVNSHAPRDEFQDFDILYVVTAPASFRADERWIERFGELMILQMPEEMGDPPAKDNGSVVYLAQFMDGNRIDLTLFPIEKLKEMEKDSLSVTLLDKDGILPEFPPPNETSYLPKPPTRKQFDDCCNEFWWVSLYAAKGLRRGQITYAHFMLDNVVRDELMKMLTWHIGECTAYAVNPGGYGKYFQKHLEPELWQELLKIYADAQPAHIWDALFAACGLFRRVAVPLALARGFAYPAEADRRVSARLHHLRDA